MEKEREVIGVGTLKITDKAKEYVNQVLDSNRLSHGDFSKRFEKEFANIHGSKFGFMINSGTSALHLAVACLKEIHNWHDGDEVLVPAVTFIATSNVVLHNNLKPVFVDVEKEFYGINPQKIEEKISEKTRAIIPVHLFGMPCNMDEITGIAKNHNLKIIEDSCETMFAKHKGQSVGSFGDINCFSTYVAHLLTTGVGGLNTTNNLEYATKLKSLANHGRDSIYLTIDDDKGKTGEELKEVISKRFSFVSLGHSFRLTEMEAALGVAQLENWEKMVSKRRKNADYLINNLSHLSDRIQLPKIRPQTEHSFMMFPVVLLNEEKSKMVNFLEENKIETRDLMPITNQPIYKKILNLNESDFPVADWLNKNGFYIGCHQDLSQNDLDHIIKTFNEYFTDPHNDLS